VISVKLLVCTTEYYPYGSGIANVAYNVVEKLKEKRVDCVVCSPTGPDIFLGNKEIISKFGRIGLLYFWFKVSKFFKGNPDYDIVWLHQPLFMMQNPFVKSVSTIHTTALGRYEAIKKGHYSFFLKSYHFVSRIIENYSTNRVLYTTRFITDSPKVNQELMKITNNRVMSKYIPNGVDISRFHPLNDKSLLRLKFGIPSNTTIFLSVGRLTSQKNLFSLLDIFNIVQKIKNGSFLLIAGKGELKSKIEDYIKKNKILNVLLLGFVSDIEFPALYSSADYYIMSSEYEGQPLTLLEAMSSGLPCIVSDIPNLKIVEEADCGIIVNFLDKDKTVKQIVDYISKDNSKHSINARKYAENSLDWNIISKKYLDEFKNF
jgi:1,2-diacylglycerol 3-alpha-glucosyltransferase